MIFVAHADNLSLLHRGENENAVRNILEGVKTMLEVGAVIW